MHSYVKKLQSKPEEERKQVLYFSLIVAMTLVVFVWVYNLRDHFNSQTAAKASSDIQPFKLFANSVSNTYTNIQASAGKAQSISTNAKSSEKQIDLVPVERTQ